MPGDYSEFPDKDIELLRDTVEGQGVLRRWRDHWLKDKPVPDIRKYSEKCPGGVFLALLQTSLVAARLRGLEHHCAGLRSPKREQAADEAVPAKRAKLLAEAESDEAQAFAEWTSPTFGLAEFASEPRRRPSPGERQRRVQRKQDRTPPDGPQVPVRWSAPMSVQDYVRATGKERKAIERLLKKLDRRPSFRGRAVTDPARYSSDVNLEVFSHWIGNWISRSGSSLRLHRSHGGVRGAS